MSQNHSKLTPVDGVPVAVPLGSSSEAASLQVGRARGRIRAPNTPARAEPERPGRPHSKRAGRGRIGGLQLERIRQGLSDRDRQILHELAVHGYLSTKHIEGLCFTGHTPVTAERLSRRIMSRLERLGLVQAIQRRVGGVRAGSSATVWQLSRAGRRLLATTTSTTTAAKRPREPSPRLLAHSLAVADTRLTLQQLTRDDPTIQSVDVQVESAAWRHYLGLGGDRRLLQPDLAATLHGHDDQGDYEDRWFIEVDCGTESIPTLLKKCRQYDDYRQSGSEQTLHGVFPRVRWVMGGSRRELRADDLRHRIDRTAYPRGMFTVTTGEEVAAEIGGKS